MPLNKQNIINVMVENVEKDIDSKHNSNALKQMFVSEFIKNKDRYLNVLYIDVPYCHRKCTYCVYQSKIISGDCPEDYINVEIYERIIKNRQIFENVKFDMIYFGGGTPNILNAKQLQKIYNVIPEFENIKWKMTESHPVYLDDEQIELYKKHKFCYLSLGIQTLDKKLLNKNNRDYISKNDLIELVKKLDGLFFNIDLIAYLGYEIKNIKSAKEDLEFMCKEIKAPSITVHHLCRMKKTKESVEKLFNLVKEICEKYDYVCVNSNIDKTDFDITLSKDAVRRINELRIIRKDKLHEYIPSYMINQINGQYAYGFNLLALGDPKIKQIHSSTGDILYYEHDNAMFVQNDKNDMDYNNFRHLANIFCSKNISFASKRDD